MDYGHTEKRNAMQGPVSPFVIYPPERIQQTTAMLTTRELLARLREKGVKNADIARALNVTPSRVTELFDNRRALKLDEAVKLAAAFELIEPLSSRRESPLPPAIARLAVSHIAAQLGIPLAEDDPRLRELAEDLRAFVEFVNDPKVRESIDLAMAFLQAMRIRRPAPEEVS